MSGALILRNRQRTRPVNLRLLRRVAEAALEELAWDAEAGLGIYLVASAEMARLNETYLQHKGPTDVITFDYGPGAGEDFKFEISNAEGRIGGQPARRMGAHPVQAEAGLRGEIFVCMEEAVAQARQFRSTWPFELTRYVIHGVLHLQGHDDLRAVPRRRMKQAENRLLRRLAGRFDLKQLARS